MERNSSLARRNSRIARPILLRVAQRDPELRAVAEQVAAAGLRVRRRTLVPTVSGWETVVEHLGVDAEKVTEEASFIDDLGADSLDIVELVMAFEEEFGVEIPDDAAEKITTVKDAISFIDSNKA